MNLEFHVSLNGYHFDPHGAEQKKYSCRLKLRFHYPRGVVKNYEVIDVYGKASCLEAKEAFVGIHLHICNPHDLPSVKFISHCTMGPAWWLLHTLC